MILDALPQLSSTECSFIDQVIIMQQDNGGRGSAMDIEVHWNVSVFGKYYMDARAKINFLRPSKEPAVCYPQNKVGQSPFFLTRYRF